MRPPPNARRRPGTNRTADVVQRLGGRGNAVTVTELDDEKTTSAAVSPTMFYTVGDQLLPDPRIVRDVALSIVEKSADEQDRAVIDQAIRVLGRQRGHVTANDVREVLPKVRPALIGSRFLTAAKRGDLEEDGTVRANHAAGHARRIVRWRWTGAR